MPFFYMSREVREAHWADLTGPTLTAPLTSGNVSPGSDISPVEVSQP